MDTNETRWQFNSEHHADLLRTAREARLAASLKSPPVRRSAGLQSRLQAFIERAFPAGPVSAPLAVACCTEA